MILATPRDGDFRPDARLTSSGGDLLVELKRTSTAVEIRGVLVSLIELLSGEPPSTQAVCVLTDTRLTTTRLEEELARFRAVIRPDLTDRVSLIALRGGNAEGELSHLTQMMWPEIQDLVQRETSGQAGRVSQQAVRAATLTRWLTTAGRVTVSDMRRATGASMPTVTAAFRTMEREGVIIAQGNGWELADEIPWPLVRRLAEEHASERRVIRFLDLSGHARTPMKLAARLQSLQIGGECSGVGLGGVLGAQTYYQELDITAAPRLDLCVYDGDTSFVTELDAGLVVEAGWVPRDRRDKPAVVVHLTKAPMHGEWGPGHARIASEIDCLADLLELGLQAEARDFWHALFRRRRELVHQQEKHG
jgi:hypothetical protein